MTKQFLWVQMLIRGNFGISLHPQRDAEFPRFVSFAAFAACEVRA